MRAVNSVITAKNAVAPMSTGRRPTLSATMVNTTAPRSTPKLPAPTLCQATVESSSPG